MNYRETYALSGSALGELERSPAHYREAMDNPVEPTDAMLLGSMVHTIQLEEHEFFNRYIVLPEGMRRDKRSKDYQSFLLQAGSKEVIRKDDFEVAGGMKTWTKQCKQWQSMWNQVKEVEKPIFWEEDGVKCKGKLDIWLPDLQVVIDYKTTVDASKKKSYYTIHDMGYALQLVHYMSGMKHVLGLDQYPAAIVYMQEKKAPYVGQAYEVSINDLSEAYEKRKELLAIYRQCMETGVWGGYSDQIEKLELV